MDAFLSCNQCGKCCNSGPSLSFSEIFKFQDKFVIGLFVQAQSERIENYKIAGYKTASEEDIISIREHQDKLFSKVATWNGAYYLQFFPMDIGYSVLKEHSCGHLNSSGACDLHNDKPNMCRSVPFDAVMPEGNQEYVLERFMNSFSCLSPSGVDNNLIYRDGKITNGSYLDGYKAKFEDLQSNTLYNSLLAKMIEEGTPGLPPLGYFIDAAKRGARVEMSIIYYLSAYLSEGDDFKEKRAKEIKEFCENQIHLSEELIAKAISRKMKSDMPRTKALRDNIYMLKVMKDSCIAEFG